MDYNQRVGAENLIKETNNDAGLAAYPSARWAMNCNHFQMAMLAYDLNCWLMLFNREEKAACRRPEAHDLGDLPLALPVSGGQDLATRGRVGVSYSDHYPEQGIFQRLMERLRAIAVGEKGYVPVLAVALRSGGSSVHKILCIRKRSRATSYRDLTTGGKNQGQNRTGRQHGSGSRHWLRRQIGRQSVHNLGYR